eukprot:jgi/Psemu1/7645/gm1.7645_g
MTGPTAVEDPTKGLGESVTGVEISFNEGHFDESALFPFLDGNIRDGDVSKDGSYYVEDKFGSIDHSSKDVFSFSGAESSLCLIFGLVDNGGIGKDDKDDVGGRAANEIGEGNGEGTNCVNGTYDM